MARYPATQTPVGVHSGDGPFLTGELNAIYQHYFSRLLAVATTRYRWLGLGAWIDPMRVEWMLVTQGLAAFTFVRQREDLPDELIEPDPERPDWNRVASDRFTVTRAAVTGYLDDTYTPAGYQTYAPNGAGGIHFRTTLPARPTTQARSPSSPADSRKPRSSSTRTFARPCGRSSA